MRWTTISVIIFIAMTFTEANCKLPQSNEELTHCKHQFEQVGNYLQKTISASSLIQAKNFVSNAKSLVRQLPKSEVKGRLSRLINDAEAYGLNTAEGKIFLSKAKEISETVTDLLHTPSQQINLKQAMSALRAVLNSYEFRDPLAPLKRWLDKTVLWLIRKLEPAITWLFDKILAIGEVIGKVIGAVITWVWSWLKVLLQTSPLLGWLLFGLLVIFVIVAVGHSIRVWWLTRQKAIAKSVFVKAMEKPEQLLLDAETAAKAGDFLTAVRKAYRALLLLLDRTEFIRFREQRTNWEYLAEIRKTAHPEVSKLLAEATNIFDICFYAQRGAKQEDYLTVKKCALQFQQIVMVKVA